MASSDKQKNAERVRWAERERLARCGSSTANTLDPLTNPNLLEVEVRGDSDIKNELNLTDANKDANVLFTLYDPPVAGDEIHVMWGGVPVLPVTTITTETAGSSMVIPIPWSVIDDGQWF